MLEEFGVRMDAQMGNAQRQASLRGEFDVYCQDGTAVILAFAGLSNRTPALRVYMFLESTGLTVLVAYPGHQRTAFGLKAILL